jgi:hypothetical protein
MKIDNANGWTEVIIEENCSSDKFYKIASILHAIFGFAFLNKISDFDSIYWDFDYNGTELTLHYNNYFGVSIFPRALTKALEKDNKTVTELYQNLSASSSIISVINEH